MRLGSDERSPDLPERLTTRFDIMGDDTAADPFPALRELRERGPVIWHEVHNRWLITSDRAIRKLLSDSRTYTVEDTIVVDLFGADAFISIDDRKRHDRLRNIWVDAFRKPKLDELRPKVEEIVARLLAPVAERLHDGEPVDITATMCRPLPTMVIALMMGIADEMQPDIVRWSDAMAAGGSAYISEEVARTRTLAREEAKSSLAAYLLERMAYRRRHPGEDLVSSLVNAEAARGLPDEQLVQNLRQLLFAGNETTAKWLAHIFVNYAERPDVRRELVENPALIEAANDEVMRWAGVVGTVVRRVRGGPVEIGGVELADRDEMTLLLTSGNRDPARYAHPDAFDIHRPALPNLGFGVGLHNCLGSVLAKVEGAAAVNQFLRAAPDFGIAAPYRYSSLPLRGPMPVVVALDR